LIFLPKSVALKIQTAPRRVAGGRKREMESIAVKLTFKRGNNDGRNVFHSLFYCFFFRFFFRFFAVYSVSLPLALLLCIFFSSLGCYGECTLGAEAVVTPPAKINPYRQAEDKITEIVGKFELAYNKLWNGDNDEADQNLFDKHLCLLVGLLLGCTLGCMARGIYLDAVYKLAQKKKKS
jgi:hypothetical protein